MISFLRFRSSLVSPMFVALAVVGASCGAAQPDSSDGTTVHPGPAGSRLVGEPSSSPEMAAGGQETTPVVTRVDADGNVFYELPFVDPLYVDPRGSIPWLVDRLAEGGALVAGRVDASAGMVVERVAYGSDRFVGVAAGRLDAVADTADLPEGTAVFAVLDSGGNVVTMALDAGADQFAPIAPFSLAETVDAIRYQDIYPPRCLAPAAEAPALSDVQTVVALMDNRVERAEFERLQRLQDVAADIADTLKWPTDPVTGDSVPVDHYQVYRALAAGRQPVAAPMPPALVDASGVASDGQLVFVDATTGNLLVTYSVASLQDDGPTEVYVGVPGEGASAQVWLIRGADQGLTSGCTAPDDLARVAILHGELLLEIPRHLLAGSVARASIDLSARTFTEWTGG